MEKRLFFLKQDGWFEVEVTENLRNASPDDLARWVYKMVDRYKFRNYLITENPGETVIGKRYSITDTGYSMLNAGYAGRKILHKTLISQTLNLSPKT